MWALGLGLRRPSEPTVQSLLALKLHLEGGHDDKESMAHANDRWEQFKAIKGHFRKMAQNGGVPTEWVQTLPLDPEEFAEQYPGIWQDFSATRGNELVKMEERWHLQLAAIKATIPMRGTHSMVNNPRTGVAESEAAGSTRAALNSFLGMSQAQSAQLAQASKTRRRLMEKTPPETKFNRAMTLLEELTASERARSAGRPSAPAQPQVATPPAAESPPVTPDAKRGNHGRDTPVPGAPTKNGSPGLQLVPAEVNAEDESDDYAERVAAAAATVQTLDQAVGLKRPASSSEMEPVKKSKPTPQKPIPVEEQEADSEVMKKPGTSGGKNATRKPAACLSQKTESKCMRKPAAQKSTVPSKPMKSTNLPKPSPSLRKQYSHGCPKCRWQASGRTPSCYSV